MYLPFGKLFHIFQRPGNLGVAYYKRANAEGPPAVCRRCGDEFASAQQIADLQATCSRRSGSTTRSPPTATATTRTRARSADRLSGVGADRRAWEGSADGTSTAHRCRTDRPLRAAPQPGAARWMERGHRGRQGRRHALLFLRPAVRHQVEGARQRGRRLRTLVRLPVQRRQALPEGRQAVPAGQPPRSGPLPDGTRRAPPGRVPRVSPGTKRSIEWCRRSAASRMPTARLVRDVVRCVVDEREELPDRQVRPPRVAHREPRLQRPLLHGVGRCRQQEGARHRPGLEPVERHPARRCGVDRRHQHRRDVPDHDELHLEGPRPWRPADRAGPARRAARPHRGSVPAGAARAPTRRCSARCCTS
jgi:hypothetical protein